MSSYVQFPIQLEFNFKLHWSKNNLFKVQLYFLFVLLHIRGLFSSQTMTEFEWILSHLNQLSHAFASIYSFLIISYKENNIYEDRLNGVTFRAAVVLTIPMRMSYQKREEEKKRWNAFVCVRQRMFMSVCQSVVKFACIIIVLRWNSNYTPFILHETP